MKILYRNKILQKEQTLLTLQKQKNIIISGIICSLDRSKNNLHTAEERTSEL